MTATHRIAAIAHGAHAFKVAPFLRKDAAEAERVATAVSAEMDAHSRHDMVLAALKDLEDDRATEKIDEDDYQTLKNKLSTRAVELMKQMDVMDEEHAKKEARQGPRAIPHPSSKP
jgi:hypothetical protein